MNPTRGKGGFQSPLPPSTSPLRCPMRQRALDEAFYPQNKKRIFFLMSNQNIALKRHQGNVTHVQKRHSQKTSCPHAFYANLINKIQQFQICAITKNMTPTIQSGELFSRACSVIL